MRLHWGSPPIDNDFQPEVEGWTPMREPSPLLLNVIALPVAFVVGGLLIAGWTLANWSHVAPALQPAPLNDEQDLIVFLATAVLGLAGLIVVHELLHALAYPKFGFTSDVLIGIWPTKLLFYAVSLGIVSRTRMLVVYLLPLLVLSVLPLVICLVLGISSNFLAVISVVNGMLASGDVAIVGMILWQIPADAEMKNKGWPTWWRRIGS